MREESSMYIYITARSETGAESFSIQEVVFNDSVNLSLVTYS
jgi:hypothetical protein